MKVQLADRQAGLTKQTGREAEVHQQTRRGTPGGGRGKPRNLCRDAEPKGKDEIKGTTMEKTVA